MLNLRHPSMKTTSDRFELERLAVEMVFNLWVKNIAPEKRSTPTWGVIQPRISLFYQDE